MNFTLYNTDRAFIDISCIIFCLICFYQRFPSVYGKTFRKQSRLTATIPNLILGTLFIVLSSSISYKIFFLYIIRKSFMYKILAIYLLPDQTVRFSPFSPRKLPSGKPPSACPISHLFAAASSLSSPSALCSLERGNLFLCQALPHL